MSAELLPCPFCGSSDISDGEILGEHGHGVAFTQSECQTCRAVGPMAPLENGEVDYGDVKARAAWNRRAQLPSAQPVEASGNQRVTCYGVNAHGQRVMSVHSAQAICDMSIALMERSCKDSLSDVIQQPSAQEAVYAVWTGEVNDFGYPLYAISDALPIPMADNWKLYTAPTLRPVSDEEAESFSEAIYGAPRAFISDRARKRARSALESFLARRMGGGW